MRFSASVLCLLLTSFGSGAHAAEPAPVQLPPPAIKARSHLLIDYDSGRVLAEAAATQRMQPGDFTKLMTMYVVEREMRNGKLRRSDRIDINESATRIGGIRMFMGSGSRVSVDDLQKGLAIQSADNAAVVLAEHIAGNETAFVALMNQYAQLVGMADSRFANSTGAPHPDQYTTARDLAELARRLIRDFPDTYRLYAMKEFTYNGIAQTNRNTLLWTDESVDGVAVAKVGRDAFGQITSARRNNMRLIAVVLDSGDNDTLTAENRKLLAYGFNAFETHRLYAAQQALTEAVIFKGKQDTLPLGLISDLYVTIPRGQYERLSATLDLSARIVAPAERGQRIGRVRVKLGAEDLTEKDLVALENVPPGDFVNNFVDDIKLMFE